MSGSEDSRNCRATGWPGPAGPEPPRLDRGDLVAVVAPGFGVRRRDLEAGVAALRSLGYRPRLAAGALDRHGYLAGDDEGRADDLARAWLDPDVRGIWFARGGFGTARLLDLLPWRRLRRTSKLLIGYSDATALFAPALARTACAAVYGPVVVELPRRAAWHAPSLRRALRGDPDALRFRPGQVLHPGTARGPMLGGNLTVLNSLLGTPWFPDLAGAVLAIEDVGEETYRVDRSLTQLRMSGALDRVAAVLLGRFDPPPRRRFPPERRFADVVREITAPLGVPVVRDLPFGHVPRKRSLALGAIAEVDTATGRVAVGSR